MRCYSSKDLYNWKDEDIIIKSEPENPESSFHSQISSVFKVPGKKDLYIACADRWLPEAMDKKYEVYARMFKSLFKDGGKSFDFSEMGAPVVENTSIADYVWLPLRFDGNMVYIDWKDSWRLEDYPDEI